MFLKSVDDRTVWNLEEKKRYLCWSIFVPFTKFQRIQGFYTKFQAIPEHFIDVTRLYINLLNTPWVIMFLLYLFDYVLRIKDNILKTYLCWYMYSMWL